MKHERCYVSCNCNQTPTAAHWGSNNLICYAACNAVVIYDPKWGSGGKVVASLVGHTKRVNSVRWLSEAGQPNELVSGASDHTAIVWRLNDGKYVPFVLQHESIVNIVDGIYKNEGVVVVTVGMDSAVKIWFRTTGSDVFTLIKDINCGHSICIGVRLSFLPQKESLILACGMDTSAIDLYIEENEFSHCHTLKGHEDWVRGLDFTTDGKDLLLASSSQDYYIRLWRFTPHSDTSDLHNVIKLKNAAYKVSLDTILTGHEGWIFSVNWNPKLSQLLSSSLDKSMIIWELDPSTNLWIEKVRVGEVGGNTMGFYGGVFSPDGQHILAHGYNGAFHLWENTTIEWKPCVTIGGHFAEVTDLAWDPQGEFLMTVSADQTTRIHAPWSDGKEVTWHEIARPQVHGYDMSSVTILSRYRFASSAEEKVIRTFEAPRNFVENFARICKITDIIEGECAPKGASVPSLGLSNKAVFLSEEGDQESHFTEVALTAPPTEETLLQNTLWPEIQKLYGHGYEVYSLASSPDGRFLASACKATTPEHAAILLWDTSNWKQIQKLVSHTLTVVQMSFSPDSEQLLSVSRDRRWSLFSKKSNDAFELVATTDKKTSIHTRIIWCCGWAHDSKYFATGSRDGKVAVWTKNENKQEKSVLGLYEAASVHLELKNESVTAVAFAPDCVLGSYLIAVGLEVGVIHCFKWSTNAWERILFLDKNVAHHLTVKRLAFRPVFGTAGQTNDEKVLQLASCGSDSTVIVHNFFIK
ncbi:probable elongator complex protein 2 [Tribolium madens]|uniref:probable elongator complex protein 2 n=1 Tax=Tribolium madens TaxID=41895 RepID=UPI001CF7286B|nr:probable elongator complex protein 2 [Tribolium madens]